MSRKTTPKALLDDLDAIKRALAPLNDVTVRSLYDRGARVAGRDGYPSSTEGGDGRRGSGPSSTVERAALAGYPDDPDAANLSLPLSDPTGRLLDELFRLIGGPMVAGAYRVRDILSAIEAVAPSRRTNSVEICGECNQPCIEGCHMVDGTPYCRVGGCYHRQRRRRIRQNGGIPEDEDA